MSWLEIIFYTMSIIVLAPLAILVVLGALGFMVTVLLLIVVSALDRGKA